MDKYKPIANPTIATIIIVANSITYLLKYNAMHATNKHAHKYNQQRKQQTITKQVIGGKNNTPDNVVKNNKNKKNTNFVKKNFKK